VTDAFDRRLVTAYLENYLHPELLDGFQARREDCLRMSKSAPVRVKTKRGKERASRCP
jgi:hypothetical protein